MTVLTKSFYGNILFIIFMNTGCDNFEALILNNITCISVYYSFLYIVYSLMVAYLKAETSKSLFFVTNNVVFDEYVLAFIEVLVCVELKKKYGC
jgi:hypothetical protein